nr:DUF3164 family protein [Mucilaginibacter sp. L294]
MQNLQVIQQKPADRVWLNEAGDTIPYDRTKPSERANERKLPSLAKKRIALRKQLEEHKAECFAIGKELYQLFLDENGGKAPRGKGKGNIIRYNFDRSIKIEINVNEPIVFDESLLQLAKAKLDELLSDGLTSAPEWFKPIVMEAFSSQGGTIDTKRVLGLRRYADSIPDKRYHEAMSLIDKAIRRPSSKEYFSLFVRSDNGEYVDVHLNFSNI